MKYYLIDYENVNAAGLEGIDIVTQDSRVVLFYTKNSSKIDLGVFNLLRSTSAELAVIEVHHGKQALDIQLASYVGFLIGTEPADTEYYIVSKDKGYRNIQDFWSDRRIVLCTSLREDSEIVDEPKPASKSRSSSKGGRRSSSRSSAKAGEKEEKTETAGKAEKTESSEKESRNGREAKAEKSVKAGKAEGSASSEADDRSGSEQEKTDHRSAGKKGFKTKAEKNSKRERHDHDKDAASADDDAPASAAGGSVPAEKAADTDGAQAAEAKPKEPVVNAFAEAAALAAAMAAAKNENGRTDSVIIKNASSPASESESPEKKAPEAQGTAEAQTAAEDAAEGSDPAEKKPAAKRSRSRKKAGTKSKEAAAADEKADEKADAKSEKKADAETEKKADAEAEKAETKKNGGKQKVSLLRNEANTEIQKILSKEGFPGDDINHAASFVSKNIGKDGYKQLIYRGLIKNFGREKGLSIYRLIKGVL